MRCKNVVHFNPCAGIRVGCAHGHGVAHHARPAGAAHAAPPDQPQDMPTRVLADAKFGDAQAANNALMNLCELPVLFYVLGLALIVVNRGDVIFLTTAWAYVLLRAVQALSTSPTTTCCIVVSYIWPVPRCFGSCGFALAG